MSIAHMPDGIVLQARAAETMAGAAPQVQRNKGTMGSKDLHLENFSVSNGGQELIEVRYIPLAHFWRIHILYKIPKVLKFKVKDKVKFECV